MIFSSNFPVTLPSSDGAGEENSESEAAGATFFVTVAQLVAYLGPEFKSYIS